MTLKDSLLQKIIRFFGYEWSGALVAIFVLSIAIELSTDGQPFFHPSNLMTILNNAAAVGVIAGGMTVVILTAGIDLSVGSVMGLIAALTGYVASFWGIDPSLAIGIGLLLAVMVGAVNGLFISYWKMPAFIVTLAGYQCGEVSHIYQPVLLQLQNLMKPLITLGDTTHSLGLLMVF